MEEKWTHMEITITDYSTLIWRHQLSRASGKD